MSVALTESYEGHMINSYEGHMTDSYEGHMSSQTDSSQWLPQCFLSFSLASASSSSALLVDTSSKKLRLQPPEPAMLDQLDPAVMNTLQAMTLCTGVWLARYCYDAVEHYKWLRCKLDPTKESTIRLAMNELGPIRNDPNQTEPNRPTQHDPITTCQPIGQ